MIKKLYFSLFLVFILLISGCTDVVYEASDEVQDSLLNIELEPEVQPLDIEPGAYQERYTDPDTTLSLDYYLFIPEDAYVGMPLLIFLHGDGEVGNVNLLEDNPLISQAEKLFREDFPFIVLAPCTFTSSWTHGSIPETLKGLIDATAQRCKVDMDHITISGHSRGATGAYYMVSTYGEFFSAAVTVSCPSIEVPNIENCAQIPIWSFAGTVGEDERYYNRIMREFADEVNDLGGHVSFTELDGYSHIGTQTRAFTMGTMIWMTQQ